MTQPKNDKIVVTPEEVALLSQRITAIEQMLAAKIPGFEQVGTRVAELSSAFQQANGRLSAIEGAVRALQDAPAPGGAEDIAALRATVAALADRVSIVEQTRARGGRLSRRLASIEAKLDQAIDTNTGGNA